MLLLYFLVGSQVHGKELENLRDLGLRKLPGTVPPHCMVNLLEEWRMEMLGQRSLSKLCRKKYICNPSGMVQKTCTRPSKSQDCTMNDI